MPMKVLPVFIIFLFILSGSASSQKTTDSLFADFDLFTLQGIRNVPLNNPDSIRKTVKYRRTATGEIKEIEVIRQYRTGVETRKASVRHTHLGTLIGFKTLKTDGWEKVIIFGQKYYYHDSVLIRNDTIFTKSLY